MSSIERTAYPRFRHDPNARELQDLFTPAQEEVGFVHSLIRETNQHVFAAMLLLKVPAVSRLFSGVVRNPRDGCE